MSQTNLSFIKSMRRLQFLSFVGVFLSLSAYCLEIILVADSTAEPFLRWPAVLNCSIALLSKYASLGGVPIALVASLWFSIVGLLARRPRKNSPLDAILATWVLRWSSVAAVSITLFLLAIAAFQLRSVCVLCVLIGIVAIAVFGLVHSDGGLSFSATGSAEATAQTSRSRWTTVGTFVLAVALSIHYAPKDNFDWKSLPSTEADLLADGSVGNRKADLASTEVTPPPFDPSAFDPKATVIVLEFIDYQCPDCLRASKTMIPVLRDLERDARGAMKYIVKDFPLDSTCNWKLLRPKHLGACEAAVAMRIAAEVGVAQPLAQWIEANQRNLTTESVDEQVRLLGFGPALRDGRYRAALAVKRDIGDGLALGVRSTPTFFINGVRVEGVLPPVQFRKVVGEAMRIADSRSHPAR